MRLLAFALVVTLMTLSTDSTPSPRHARSAPPLSTDPTLSDVTAMLQDIVGNIKAGTAPTTDNLLLDKFVSLVKNVAPGNLAVKELTIFAGNIVKSLGGATKTSKENRDKIIANVTVGLLTAKPDLDGVIKEVGRNAALLGDGSLVSVAKVLKPLMPGDGAKESLTNTASIMFDLNSILSGFGVSPGAILAAAARSNGTFDVTKVMNTLGGGANTGALGGSAAEVSGLDLANLMGRFGLGFKQDAGVGSPGGGGFDFTKFLTAAAKGGSSAPGGGSVDLFKMVGALGGQGKQAGGVGGQEGGGGGSSLVSMVSSLFGSMKGAGGGASGGLDLEGMLTNVLASQSWKGRG